MRLLGWFVLVFAALFVLRELPFVGGLFRIPLVGFFLAAVVVGLALERAGRWLLHRRRFQDMQRQLGAVDTPHNRGKLGTLLLTQKRYAKATGHLEAAVAGEPESAEWSYRLGCALLGARRAAEAAEALERAAGIDDDHAYGAVLLRLAEAQQRLGAGEQALASVERFERAHGPTPESAYRKGVALKSLARGDDARAAFDEVARSARHVARYQRGEARGWVARAALARFFR